jgi:hypothetical protein
MDPKIQFKHVLNDIRGIKFIRGDSNVDYFDSKYLKRNILLTPFNICIRPADIYDFYNKPERAIFPRRYPGHTRFVDESWGSYHYNYILIPKKNNYIINTWRGTCSCPFRGNDCKHLHYYKDLYNLYLVFCLKFGMSIGLCLSNEYKKECNKRPKCYNCSRSITWYFCGEYLCNKCKIMRQKNINARNGY